jgi:hypothetical protein
LGIPGIIFLMGIIVFNLIAGERTLRQMKVRSPECGLSNRNLVIALNASLVGFAVGGAFLSATYYPHIYMLAGLLECGRDLSRETPVSETVKRMSQADSSPVFRGVSA